MLKIKDISKSYKTGDFVQKALDKVSLSFRPNEFVSILGPSGSGKTTLLNIIGGLDRYDSGDLIINGKSTKSFKAKEWDAYRNNCIGFVFQNYNLITHISVLANVELGLTLSGVSKRKKKKLALDALDRVGLLDHAHKKPNQLSGGQMQRVAIARALVTDPDIILADEPTGALDSKTSKEIMELIKEIAKEKLVIMVTHNREIAEKYSTRIVELKDGKIVNDNNEIKEKQESNDFTIKKTKMNFLEALTLSFNNIRTKKGRTFLTSFAASIGIIGIALILSLSNGFQKKIDEFQDTTLAKAPILIMTQSMNMDTNAFKDMTSSKLKKFPTKKEIYPKDDMVETLIHNNKITKEYEDYIKDINPDYVSSISYTKTVNLIAINKDDEGKYNLIPNTTISNNENATSSMWVMFPYRLNNNNTDIVSGTYDTLAGKIEDDKPGLVLMVDTRNRVSASILKQLGFTKDLDKVSFEDIMNKEIKVILNDDYYTNIGGNFVPKQDYESLYNNDNAVTVKVQAILRGKDNEEAALISEGDGIGYTKGLMDIVINKNDNSEIVKAQKDLDYNIMSHAAFDKEGTNTKENFLGYLGADTSPYMIMIYPNDFDSKDHIIKYLDKYNKDKKGDNKVEYTDQAELITSLTKNIMNAITIVLIAFSSISLIVSSIMIGIITYISVLERTKEIGILRALGARRKDIKRVFIAEVVIVGILSGIIGIGIAYLLTIPANMIIKNLSNLTNVAQLSPIHAIILITISVILTIIGGRIPSGIASKKDPVEALRSE
ncbi:MAG: ABC transporter ATP-binding protein/permease [Bacilli bacterium]|nr:ABC transporter ATP-binding protein/permease [Bacilli bacterium]